MSWCGIRHQRRRRGPIKRRPLVTPDEKFFQLESATLPELEAKLEAIDRKFLAVNRR